MKKLFSRIAMTLLAFLFIPFFADSVLACVEPPNSQPEILVKFLTETRVLITALDYQTFGVDGTNCACGLIKTGAIQSIDDVQIFQAGTTDPVPGFAFSPNATTSASLADAAGSGDWSGFKSEVANVAGGQPVDIQFDVTFFQGQEATLFEELGNAASLVGTDEANSDGSLALTHLNIVQGNVLKLPLLSAAGLISLSALLLLISLLAIRRMRAGGNVQGA